MAKKDATIQADIVAPAISKFDFQFIVINPFGDYQYGQRIADEDAIQTIIDNGDDINCNRIIVN
jgi:flagellar assembly factor FliW